MKTSALTAIGFILVGSLAFALEATKKNKFWDNEVYKSRYNEAVRGTPLPQLNVVLNSSDDETRKILLMVEQDKAGDLGIFLRDITSLPEIVQRNLRIYSYLGCREAFGKASTLFIEASRRLKTITTPADLGIPEIEKIDGYKPEDLSPAFNDFLKELFGQN